MYPRMARVAAIVVVVLFCAGLGIGAAVLLQPQNTPSNAAPEAPRILRDGQDESPDQPETETTPPTSEGLAEEAAAPTTAAATSTVPTCTDDFGSAYWPTTTQGPIVLCPENPYGVPSRALAPISAGWIAVLESVPIFEVQNVDARLTQIESITGLVSVSDSRNYFGLRDPYFVIHAGPFVDRATAASFCSNRPNLDPCYPRQL